MNTVNINSILVPDSSKLWLPEEPFTGTFREFLPYAKENPFSVASAKATMWRLVIRQGINEERTARNLARFGTYIPSYNAFKEFYGVDRQIHIYVADYLGAAVNGGEADNQVLVFIGPKGSGKSQFVKKNKTIVKSCEPLPCLKGSPMRANPLNLLYMIPVVAKAVALEKKVSLAKARAELLAELGLDGENGGVELNWNNSDLIAAFQAAGVDEVNFDGLTQISDEEQLVSAIVFGMDLPRSTRNNIGRPDPYVKAHVLGTFDFEKFGLATYPVDSFFFEDDQEGSVGIASVKEVQPLNFDMRVMIGEEDIAKLGVVDRDDPRSVRLNGAYNLANRGVLEFVEGFKNPKEAHRSVLEATQDKSIPAPDPMRMNLHIDAMIWYHSNFPEFKEFSAEPKNEPYLDRMVKINWPYPLEASAQTKVVKKLLARTDFAKAKAQGGVHFEPIVPEYLSRFAVLTRMSESTKVQDPMMKLEAYDGNEGRLRGLGIKVDVQALMLEAGPDEGMDGASPRFIDKILTGLASQAKSAGRTSVTLREVRTRLYEEIGLIGDKKTKERYELFVTKFLDTWQRKTRARILRAAHVDNFKPQCQEQFKKYVDQAQAYGANKPTTMAYGNRRPIDENFMRNIEADPELGITSAQADKFRSEVVSVISGYMQEHKTLEVPYSAYEPLARAIERFVCSKMAEAVRILTYSNAVSDDDKRRLNSVKKRLIADHGYDEYTADELLREAEETKDFLKEV
jgi:predicted Ser/Thr protein kinase